jgi:RpiR family carbohydrate utilization transcriptional regulator
MPSALASLRGLEGSLTPTLQRVAAYVRDHPDQVLYQTIVEVAEGSGVSEASVLRFCRDLGFSGFQDFKLALAADLAVSPAGGLLGAPPSSLEEVFDHALAESKQVLEETYRLLDRTAIARALDLLERAQQLDFYGVGASGVTAQDFAYKFLRLGYRAQAWTDPHLAAMSASTLSDGAVAIGISRSGSTLDTLQALEVAHRRGIPTLAITHAARSPITRIAEITLGISAPESPLTGGSISSKMGLLLVAEILFLGLLWRLPERSRAIEATAAAVSGKSV